MYGLDSREGFQEVAPGIRIKTIASGESVLMSKFRMRAGAELPAHSHPNEQIGYLLSGRIELHIGERTRDVRPGDSWCVPGGLAHRASIVEDSEALEIFSPVREDYLKFMNAADVEE
jgi:quercetin dioxygenase-like cupin family protein